VLFRSIAAGDYLLSASGSTVRFPGFMVLYQAEEDKNGAADKEDKLPKLSEKETLTMVGLDPKQHFTTPPPRFSEASLVKELEENGIGRPSTYATILSTIRDKGYVDLVNKSFRPTELGFIVNDLLVENFPTILDIEFTANMENDLDRIESEQLQAESLLQGFYEPFSRRIEAAEKQMRSVKGVGMDTGLPCPECGKELKIKLGKNGPFLACSGYPACTFSRNYIRTEKGTVEAVAPASPTVAEGKVCDKCGSPMVVKQGRYGDFLACSAYPECKNTQSLNAGNNATAIGVKCPEPGCDGDVVEKRSKRGKVFYGCSRFPKCTFASWDKPVNMACPDCGAPFVVEKTTKKEGTVLVCASPECHFRQKI